MAEGKSQARAFATSCKRSPPNAGTADYELFAEATYNSKSFEYLGA